MIVRRACQPQHRMYAAAFLLDFSVAVGILAMPFFIVERLNGGAALSGTVGAVQMALYAVCCLASAGLVSRARNSLRWAVAGVGIFGLLFILVPWTSSPGPCLVAASVPFLGLALAWPAMQAWLGQAPDPDTRARHLAGFNTATAFGFTISPLLTGPLYDANFRSPFLLLAVLCAVVIGFLFSLTPGPPRVRHASQEEPAAEERGVVPVTRGLLYASWAATFTANGLVAAVRSVYPVHVEALAADRSLVLWPGFRPALLDAVGPATTYSWLAFLLSLCTVLCFAAMGRTRAWQGRFSVLALGQIAAAVSCIVLGHAQNLVIMAACFAVIGHAYGLCFFASLYYSLTDMRERHRRAAINEGLLGAGGFTGSIGFGCAAACLGVTAAFQGAPAVAAAAIVVQILLLRSARQS